MDTAIIASIISVLGLGLVTAIVGYFNLFKKVEVQEERIISLMSTSAKRQEEIHDLKSKTDLNHERYNRLQEEKGSLHAELAEMKVVLYQMRDALIKDGKI